MPSRFEEEKARLIAAAAERVSADPDGGMLRRFTELLFAHGAGEDIVEYDAETLAAISRDAFAFFRRRVEPTAVRVADVPGTDKRGRPHSVVELSTANRPFIFDSVLGELQALGHMAHLVVHPIVEVERNAAGEVVSFGPRGPGTDGEHPRESFVHVHVPLIRDEETKAELGRRLKKLLHEVQVATEDWRAMRVRLHSAINDFSIDHPTLPESVTDETIAFLQWLEEDNFVFLGMREYAYRGDSEALVEEAKAGLGLLRDPDVTVLRRGDEQVTMTPEIRAFLVASDPIIVTKANVKSRIHRRDYMDYVGIKVFRAGRVAGELRVVGLFTSSAFTRSVQRIPLIRRQVAEILRCAGFDPLSHSGKSLLNALEHYPRTELFQADTQYLYESAMAILQLEERPRIRALARRDRFDRFVSVLVFVPRDRYSSTLRHRIGEALAEMYDGRLSAFFPDFSMTHLTRVQFIVGRNPTQGPQPTQDEIELRIRTIARSFEDDLAEALDVAYPPERAAELQRTYADAFASGYRAAFSAEDALGDMAIAERLSGDDIEVRFFHREGLPDGQLAMSFHHLGDPIPLSQRVPLLECLGFSVIDERTYRIARSGGPDLFLHDMTLVCADGQSFDIDAASRLHDAVLAVWHLKAESDGFNALILTAGLTWRRAALLRTIARYLRQTDLPYSIDYLAEALRRYPAIARLLTDHFFARFDPATKRREKAEHATKKDFEAALASVSSLDDDTILRAFCQVIDATQRTDFFAAGADEEPAAVTLKIRPRKLPFVPLPRPFREIFVHSPQVEGVHLRFGPVARGGLRWSDRPQDFRTEVLGLVKAQQVKNAVIVPVGAKGGFVPQQLPIGGRDAVFEAGRQAYIAFVDRLLSVTDDIEGDKVVSPKDVVVHDYEDAYLVVAADKGTATFSDTANGIAIKRGFWLGDAFASGGSAGYDHKAMGITARGAWEAVKRHFREMDIDIQTQPFTVAGVGDMSGDVFGNGMLLSPATKLVAAFDHRDIFIDPNPDPQTSLNERQRLFELRRSSWQDYDRSLISKGGGVFSRSAKEIELSPEARKLLKLSKTRLRPNELMTAILKAPVDLLWFGGIGTYVRGPAERNSEVGDKANDAIRITAAEINAKVVGEGANLGMTPKARIAYGLTGGRCNSDAIDNSAGVNTSDVEVNIKIALAPPVRAGKLSESERLELLREMTGDVASLVLRNNYQQTLAISLEQLRGRDNLGNQMRLMAELEERGLLDRDVESLPPDAVLEERAAVGHGLTRAEIGTLLAFAKIALFNDLVESDVPDNPYLGRELFRYFPPQMRERFADEIEGHRLRREIIATQLSNSVINRGGPTLLVAARDRTGDSVADLTHAYAAVRDSFALQDLHAEIDALDTKVSGKLQLELYAVAQDMLVDRLAWFASNLDPAAALSDIVAQYRSALGELAGILPSLVSREQAKTMRETERRLKAGGVPESLSARMALLPTLARATDVVLIAERTRRSLAEAAQSFFAISDRFGFGRIDAMTEQVETGDYYEGLALQKARDALETAHRDLSRSLISNGGAIDVAAWEAASGERITATAEQVEKILSDRRPSMAKVSVAASLLSELARG